MMDSLAEETWDVVIAGTGLVQALIALSLSRSNLKILHVDENFYYGGADAALSLDEAELWKERHQSTKGTFSSASTWHPEQPKVKLANSRAYTLSLNPQIVYAQSSLLPSLVSSTVNTQLEFMAVGSWWVYKQGNLQKVPSSREDVFADEGLSRRDKVGLMKFLRYVVQENAEESDMAENVLEGESLQSTLASKFKISLDLHLPISSLALSQQSIRDTRIERAVPRIRRHMRSVGYFGPGFGAVVAKYAGNAEIAQVCCRACAVGGATYLLGQGVTDSVLEENGETFEVTLTNGVVVRTKHLVGGLDDLPTKLVDAIKPSDPKYTATCCSINIVSSSLSHLFPPTSENGPVPAAAIILIVNSEDDNVVASRPPIYLQVHSEDTGECPSGQCIIYASTLHQNSTESHETQSILERAVQRFVDDPVNASGSSDHNPQVPEILWSMSYVSTGTPENPSQPFSQDKTEFVAILPPRTHDIAFDDNVLTTVKGVWREILGDAAQDEEFLRFEDRSRHDPDDS